MDFSKFMELCRHDHKQLENTFIIPQRNLHSFVTRELTGRKAGGSPAAGGSKLQVAVCSSSTQN